MHGAASSGAFGRGSPVMPKPAIGAAVPFNVAQSDAELEASMCLTRLKRNAISQAAKVNQLEAAEAELQQQLRQMVEARNMAANRLQEAEDKLELMAATQAKDREAMDKYRKDTENEMRKEREDGEAARARLKAVADSKSSHNEMLRSQMYALEDLHRDDERHISALRTELEGQRDLYQKQEQQFALLKRNWQEVDARLLDYRNEAADAKGNHKKVVAELDKQKEIVVTQHARVKDLATALEKAHVRHDQVVAHLHELMARERIAQADAGSHKELTDTLSKELAAAQIEKRKLMADLQRTQTAILGKKDAADHGSAAGSGNGNGNGNGNGGGGGGSAFPMQK